MTERESESSDLWVFSHFLHLLCSLWDRNRNHIGAGQRRVPGCYWVNNLTHTQTDRQKHTHTKTYTHKQVSKRNGLITIYTNKMLSNEWTKQKMMQLFQKAFFFANKPKKQSYINNPAQ